MNDAIFLIKDETEAKPIRLTPTPYVTEDEFQTLLERFPELLAGEQIDRENPRRWLLVGREIGISDSQEGAARWALDHLFIDQDGVPTLVEVKRQTDTRLRREVIGQVLEYAANAAKWWPGSFLKDTFEKTCHHDGRDPAAALTDFVGPIPDGADAFWMGVAKRLELGDMRLIFFADAIPPELLRIVDFLNSQMLKTEVLAIEVQRYSGGGFSTHIPRLLGQTLQAELAKQAGRAGAPRRQWDEATFFSAAQALPDLAIAALHRLHDLGSDLRFAVEFGTGATFGSCNVYVNAVGPRAVVSAQSGGKLQFLFGSLIKTPKEIAVADRLYAFATQELGLRLGSDWRKQYPTVPAEVWVSKADALMLVLDGVA